MALKTEILKKKSFSIYKAYFMEPGQPMQINPKKETFATNQKDACALLLKEYENKGEKELLSKKGAQLSILEVIFNMQKLQSSPHLDEIYQDGSIIELSLNQFQYRMKIHEYILKNFDYEVNPKDQGQSLIFSNIHFVPMD